LSQSSIAIILPPRERFRAGDAGAVALTVRDFIGASRFKDRITVYGGEPEHFEDIPYRHVPARLSWGAIWPMPCPACRRCAVPARR
jgi:hypothetical protein